MEKVTAKGTVDKKYMQNKEYPVRVPCVKRKNLVSWKKLTSIFSRMPLNLTSNFPQLTSHSAIRTITWRPTRWQGRSWHNGPNPKGLVIPFFRMLLAREKDGRPAPNLEQLRKGNPTAPLCSRNSSATGPSGRISRQRRQGREFIDLFEVLIRAPGHPGEYRSRPHEHRPRSTPGPAKRG